MLWINTQYRASSLSLWHVPSHCIRQHSYKGCGLSFLWFSPPNDEYTVLHPRWVPGWQSDKWLWCLLLKVQESLSVSEGDRINDPDPVAKGNHGRLRKRPPPDTLGSQCSSVTWPKRTAFHTLGKVHILSLMWVTITFLNSVLLSYSSNMII